MGGMVRCDGLRGASLPRTARQQRRRSVSCATLILAPILACLPLPVPDIRRPAALVVLVGPNQDQVTVRACTWSTRASPLDGCDNVTDGMPALDGIGVPEWTEFPLVLESQSPMWGDIFVACEAGRPRGATLRLPDLRVKWDAAVEVKLDAPATHWGTPPGRDIPDATVARLSADLCAGRARLRP